MYIPTASAEWQIILESNYQKFTKDVLIIGITNVLTALSGIILLPLIIKTLGAHDYGIWAQVQVTVSLVVGLVGLGLPIAMTRFLPAKTNVREIQEEFYSSLCLVFFVTLVVSIILIVAADFIGEAFFGGATDIVRLTGLLILIGSSNWVFLSLFRSLRQMKTYSIFTIAGLYGQIGLIAYLVLNGYGLFSIVLAVLTIRVVTFVATFFLVKSRIGISRPHFFRTKEYLRFGLPTVPANISAWVVTSSDRYVIGFFLGAASVGVYSASYSLGSVPFILVGVLGFVLPPALSRLYDEGRMGEVKMHLSYSLKYLLAVAIPFVFGAGLLAEPVLRLFSTADIASEGFFVVPLVALSILFHGVYVVIGHILIVVKKTKTMGIIEIIAAVANLGLNIVIVPRVGILGAAITTLVAYSLALGIGSYYSFKELRFPIDWLFIVKSLVASGIMSLTVWLIHPQGGLATIIAVIVGIAVYGLVLLLLKGFKKNELDFFRGMITNNLPEVKNTRLRISE